MNHTVTNRDYWVAAEELLEALGVTDESNVEKRIKKLDQIGRQLGIQPIHLSDSQHYYLVHNRQLRSNFRAAIQELQQQDRENIFPFDKIPQKCFKKPQNN